MYTREYVERLHLKIHELKNKNNHYRNTLKFYANERNYDRDYHGESIVEIDCGHRASQLLEVLKWKLKN